MFTKTSFGTVPCQPSAIDVHAVRDSEDDYAAVALTITGGEAPAEGTIVDLTLDEATALAEAILQAVEATRGHTAT